MKLLSKSKITPFERQLYLGLKRVMCTRQSGYEVSEPYQYARKVLDSTEALYPELRAEYIKKYCKEASDE